MSNEIAVYNGTAEIAIAEPAGENYSVQCGWGKQVTIKRGVDFDVIPGTRSPSLLKSGAEKICMGYGLFQQYELVSKTEDPANGFFMYLFRCDLGRYDENGNKAILVNGYGSANTSEKRNGRNDGYNSANATLKMAKKRALTDAALAISGLSDAFTQDMENESFMAKAGEINVTTDPNAPITSNQIKRIYAIAANNGMTAAQAKVWLKLKGFESTKSILQKDYDDICKAIAEEK